MYLVDFILQIKRLLPVLKRKPIRIAWLTVLTSGVQQIYDEFILFRNSSLTLLSYNNQTVVFEYAINNVFDNDNRGITIDNAYDNIKKEYLFFKAENERPTYFYLKSENEISIYTYFKSEFGDQTNCIFNVPIALQSKDEQLKTFIDKYKHIGINYTIIYY